MKRKLLSACACLFGAVLSLNTAVSALDRMELDDGVPGIAMEEDDFYEADEVFSGSGDLDLLEMPPADDFSLEEWLLDSGQDDISGQNDAWEPNGEILEAGPSVETVRTRNHIPAVGQSSIKILEGINLSAFAGSYVQPIYEGVVSDATLWDEQGFMVSLYEADIARGRVFSVRDTPQWETVFSSTEEAVSFVADAFTKHEGVKRFDVWIPAGTDKETVYQTPIAIILEALSRIPDSHEKDLFKLKLVGFTFIAKEEARTEEGFYLAVNYSFTHAEPSDYVNRTNSYQVPWMRELMGLDGLSDEASVSRVYSFLSSYLAYAYGIQKEYENFGFIPYSAYGAAECRKAFSHAYALLASYLLRSQGLDCRIVTGKLDGNTHVWNIVRIGNLYYNLDIAWACMNERGNGFLRGGTSFDGHVRDDEYLTESFTSAHPMADYDYAFGCSHIFDEQLIPSGLWTDTNGSGNGLRWSVCRLCGYARTDAEFFPALSWIRMPVSRFTYTGENIHPEIELVDRYNGIIDSAYYDVVYPDPCRDVRAKEYRLTVQMKGPYVGTDSKGYYIDTKAPVKISLTSPAKLLPSVSDGMSYQVTAVITEGAVGEGVHFKTNNPFVLDVADDGTIIPKAAGGATVLAYYPGSKNCRYANAKVYVFVRPQKVDFISLTDQRGILTMTWNKCGGCTYQIQYSKDPSFSERKTLTVSSDSKLSYTKGGLSRGETYYLRIRSHCSGNGKDYFSYWSPVHTYTMS